MTRNGLVLTAALLLAGGGLSPAFAAGCDNNPFCVDPDPPDCGQICEEPTPAERRVERLEQRADALEARIAAADSDRERARLQRRLDRLTARLERIEGKQ